MKMSDYTKLEWSDVIAFQATHDRRGPAQDVAVRLYKNGRWYAGLHWHTNIKDLRADMFIDRFIRVWHKDPINPCECSSELFTKNDLPVRGSYRENERSFILHNPCKTNDHRDQDKTLTIVFDTGVAILSLRENDINKVKSLFKDLEKAPVVIKSTI